LKTFPTLRFLGHSQKFWSEISSDITEAERGGIPKGKVAEGGRVVELMRKYPNLYGDLSAGSGVNSMVRDPVFACKFMEEFQDRLFYGTDICAPGNIREMRVKLPLYLDDWYKQGMISYEICEKVLRTNALRLLEI
jgi:predicted TIM-barrel fold metal-dependent hydrolase